MSLTPREDAFANILHCWTEFVYSLRQARQAGRELLENLPAWQGDPQAPVLPGSRITPAELDEAVKAIATKSLQRIEQAAPPLVKGMLADKARRTVIEILG